MKEMNDPLISIIMPIFNSEKWLSISIKSIINQTYNNWELVLIDDGSTDSSGKICDEYALLDNRIIVVHKKNGGVSSARNEGLKIAKGNYITFCDSDDWLEHDYLEKFIQFYYPCNYDIYFFGKINIINGKKIFAVTNRKNFFQSTNITESDFIEMINYNYVPSVIGNFYKHGKIRDNYFELYMSFGEDLLYNLNVLHNENKVFISNEAYYNYNRMVDSSLTISTINVNKCNDFNKIYISLYNEGIFRNYGKEYFETIHQRWKKDLDYCINSILKSNTHYRNKKCLLKILLNNKEINDYYKNVCITSFFKRLYYYNYNIIIIKNIIKSFVRRKTI